MRRGLLRERHGADGAGQLHRLPCGPCVRRRGERARRVRRRNGAANKRPGQMRRLRGGQLYEPDRPNGVLRLHARLVLRGGRLGGPAVSRRIVQQREGAGKQRAVYQLPRRLVLLHGRSEPHALQPRLNAAIGGSRQLPPVRRWDLPGGRRRDCLCRLHERLVLPAWCVCATAVPVGPLSERQPASDDERGRLRRVPTWLLLLDWCR